MYTRQQIQRKTLSNSASKSVQTSLFQQRPFNEEADTAEAPSHQQEQPDLQTQLEKATRFGHNFSQVQVNVDTPSSVIQPKLAIGAPGDKYEQEADQMAAQVMSMPAPVHQPSIQREMAPEELEEAAVQTKPLAASITPLIQREMVPELEEEEPLQTKPLEGSTIQREMAPEEEEEPLQTKLLEGSTIQREMAPESEEEEPLQTKRSPDATSQTSSDLENQLNTSKGGGSPLANEVRSFMEPRFGADFSQVRVHTDSQAVQMNKDLGAQAFTHGSDIYFGAGKSPGISDLTAHELTHVVQQTGGVQTKFNTEQTTSQIKTLSSSLSHKPIQRQTAGTQSPTQTVEVNNSIQEAPYAWTSAYEVQLTDQDCIVTIRVRINPDADVSTRDVARVQSVTANEFARYFDHRFNLRDAQGTSRPLRVRLQYVESGEHLVIALHSGTGRDDLSNWFVDSEAIDRAHELGHQLGLRDEYVDASVPNRATDTSPGVSDDHSLMGNYYDQGIRNADVRGRHGDQLAADISSATGTQFSAEFSEVYIVRRGDNLSTIALRIYGNESMWQQIYKLNRSKIRNPNLILPGLRLRLPPIPQ